MGIENDTQQAIWKASPTQVSKTIPNKQWNNTPVRIGIENDTRQKEGQPLNKEVSYANMGIENDTRQKEEQPLNKGVPYANMGIEIDTRQ